jgi:hypothetical protein
MSDTLEKDEPHPAAAEAMRYLKSLGRAELRAWLEASSSCSIGRQNRTAEVGAGTLRRILAGEPVSDRYLLGVAWTIKSAKGSACQQCPHCIGSGAFGVIAPDDPALQPTKKQRQDRARWDRQVQQLFDSRGIKP